jgi:hypothetical protein
MITMFVINYLELAEGSTTTTTNSHLSAICGYKEGEMGCTEASTKARIQGSTLPTCKLFCVHVRMAWYMSLE